MEIRPIRPEEYDALGALTVLAYQHVLPPEDLGDYGEELADVARRAKEAEVLVAVDGDTVLGGVTFVGEQDNPHADHDVEGAASIRHLAVDPAGWGRGVGRALTEACIDRARALGAPLIVLHSTPEMTSAHRIYLGFGFQRAPDLDWEVDGITLLGFRLIL